MYEMNTSNKRKEVNFMSEKKAKRLLQRNEVPEELTWDLTKVFKSDEEFEKEYQAVKDKVQNFRKLQGTTDQGSQRFLQIIENFLSINRKFEKVYVYASMKNDQDTTNAKYQGYNEMVDALAAEFSESISWFEPELLELDEDKLKQYFVEKKELKQYEHLIESMLVMRKHTLDKKSESLLAGASDIFGTSQNVFGILNNADLKFPIVKDDNGDDIQLSHGVYGKLIESTNREVRKAAFKGLYSVYDQFKHTMATTLIGNVKVHNFKARVRNYKDAREAATTSNHIPTEVYDVLLEQVHKNLPLLHRYVKLRKKILGVDELHMYDMYTPLTEDSKLTYNYIQAQIEAKKALEALGMDYLTHVSEAFENRWIDVVENKGKRSGAYSSGVYDTPPYILLNWQDNLENLFTLVHEMGHSMHSYYTSHNQPYQYGDYPIFLAEIASTTNENILTDYLLKNNNEKDILIYILNHYLDGFKGTVYRQTQFAEFEKWIHEQNSKGVPLTAKSISEYYLGLNKKYYGSDVISDPEIALEWARIPHFYYNFYVYQYATGFAAATTLAENILSGDENKLNKYLTYLKAGSSKYPLEVMKDAGVDMTDSSYLEKAFKVFEERLNQLETLLSEK